MASRHSISYSALDVHHLRRAMIYFAVLWLIEEDFRSLLGDVKTYISSIY